jgi:large subunit ribosomal protein L15
MVTLHNLPKITKKGGKRVGRGLASGKGGKSGRGTTRHQKARESIPLHFEGGQGRMVKKFPLLRGKGRNKPVYPKPTIINFANLTGFKEGEVVDVETLVKKGVVDEKALLTGVKVLGGGKLEKKLIFKVPVTKSARSAIEAVQGRIEVAGI